MYRFTRPPYQRWVQVGIYYICQNRPVDLLTSIHSTGNMFLPLSYKCGRHKFEFWQQYIDGLVPLQWRHDGRDSVWNHQPHECLRNRFFRHTTKKTSKLRVTGLCAGNSPVTVEFPAQRASNAENVSISWRHHGKTVVTPEMYRWGEHSLAQSRRYDGYINKIQKKLIIRLVQLPLLLLPQSLWLYSLL